MSDMALALEESHPDLVEGQAPKGDFHTALRLAGQEVPPLGLHQGLTYWEDTLNREKSGERHEGLEQDLRGDP